MMAIACHNQTRGRLSISQSFDDQWSTNYSYSWSSVPFAIGDCTFKIKVDQNELMRQLWFIWICIFMFSGHSTKGTKCASNILQYFLHFVFNRAEMTHMFLPDCSYSLTWVFVINLHVCELRIFIYIYIFLLIGRLCIKTSHQTRFFLT